MREIKFRAWHRVPAGEWDDEADDWKYQMNYNLAFEEYEPINDLINQVENIMQFTGVKDKQGHEIYEGDIVLVLDRDWPSSLTGENPQEYTRKIASICEVIFNEGEFILKQRKGMGYYYDNVGRYNYTRDIYEVIGNIWENPELLEK